MPSSRHVAAFTAIGGLVVALVAVPLLATPAAAQSYTDSGTIQQPRPAGNGATDLEFNTTCPDAPSSQGVDGWVFTLPASYAVAGTTVALTGSDALDLHDISAYVYKDDCTYDRVATDSTTPELSLTLLDGDTYLSVFTGNGTDVTVDLAATAPGASPSPTATTSTSPSPTPTATTSAPPTGTTRTRHAYPATPNDPLFAQDGVDDLFYDGQWGMRKINAPQAWQEARGTGAGIKVAVLDTGLDLGHPDFACDGKVDVVPGADPDPDGSSVPQDDVEGHGTHVAGIIGACTDNGTGVVGVAPDATLLPIQVLSATSSDAATLATALRTATDAGAHVVNMSLGFGVAAPGVGLTIPYTGSALGALGGLQVIDDAVDYAVSHGVVVVAAAGNESASLCGYPALAAKVVCVGSSDPNDLNSYYGNFPVKTDPDSTVGPGLLAPGGTGTPFCDLSSREVISTFSRQVDTADGNCDTLAGYASLAGTSMATPHVAGAAALVYDRIGGVRSKANGDKVVEALINSAKDLYAPGYDPASGYGRLDALAAVKYWPAAGPDPTPTDTASPTGTASPTPTDSPTPTPSAKATSLTIGTDVPATVQYRDALPLSARLVDSTGAPVAGETVAFQLQGANAFRDASAVTGADGWAYASLGADVVPGDYRVAVGYSGRANAYDSSSASQPVAVTREDTATSLTVAGTGSKRTLTAVVTEPDDASPVSGVTVTFYADGQQAGQAVTDANGVATYTPASGAKSAKTYEARFAGDACYLASAGSA